MILVVMLILVSVMKLIVVGMLNGSFCSYRLSMLFVIVKGRLSRVISVYFVFWNVMISIILIMVIEIGMRIVRWFFVCVKFLNCLFYVMLSVLGIFVEVMVIFVFLMKLIMLWLCMFVDMMILWCSCLCLIWIMVFFFFMFVTIVIGMRLFCVVVIGS